MDWDERIEYRTPYTVEKMGSRIDATLIASGGESLPNCIPRTYVVKMQLADNTPLFFSV